ncbi:hypothetical protein ACIP61_01225 [Pseudomonas fulva]|uniref:hypothetical protein n=1 Tax=Pseudomonas fulva TaxID=47880 RepID=UPI0037FE326C
MDELKPHENKISDIHDEMRAINLEIKERLDKLDKLSKAIDKINSEMRYIIDRSESE